MFNLNAIIESAHGGEAVNSLAQQFEISPQEAAEAVHALMPALSLGLQQQMQQGGIGQILSHIATQQNVAAYDDAEAAESDDTVTSGADVLNYLFGGEDTTVRVAENAAEHSSLSSELLQAMLPVVAAMVMGGLFKSIAAKGGLGGLFGGGAQPAPAPAPQPHTDGGGGIGDILGGMLGGGQKPQAPAPQGGGGVGDILGGMLGGGQRPPSQPQAPQGGGGGGLGDMLDRMSGRNPSGAGQPGGGGLGDILGQVLGGGQPGGAQPRTPDAGGSLGDLLGQILGGGSPQKSGAPQQGGGGLGDLLGQILGGGQPPQQQQGRPQAGPGGLDPTAIQAGLEQLQNMFGHGSKVSQQQKSGLDSILGQILGGGRR